MAVAFVVSGGAYAADIELALGYDSKYLSEGRDNLDEGGIAWAEGVAAFDNGVALSLAYGYATDPNEDYDELNVGVEYGVELGDLSVYGSYTRLEFFEDGESDNELGAGLLYGGLDWFEPFVDYVYSSEAKGSFVEMGIQREFELTERVSLKPYVIAGLDYGYANPDHSGQNHMAVGAEIAFQLTERLALTGLIEHTEAHRQVVREEGIEQSHTWAGVHLVMRF
ncbi:hypothetical protein GCM10023333_29290 [Ferrimonas pelagia]|uniref:Outer membrane protein beta-barrel domain-containing protein n=1 Tax=Ferrimonas pelagia TaxID=1177826 RepID=A0ABP9FEB2_9GAMM